MPTTTDNETAAATTETTAEEFTLEVEEVEEETLSPPRPDLVVPEAVDGIQVNFCKNPACFNFSMPAKGMRKQGGRPLKNATAALGGGKAPWTDEDSGQSPRFLLHDNQQYLPIKQSLNCCRKYLLQILWQKQKPPDRNQGAKSLC